MKGYFIFHVTFQMSKDPNHMATQPHTYIYTHWQYISPRPTQKDMPPNHYCTTTPAKKKKKGVVQYYNSPAPRVGDVVGSSSYQFLWFPIRSDEIMVPSKGGCDKGAHMSFNDEVVDSIASPNTVAITK